MDYRVSFMDVEVEDVDSEDAAVQEACERIAEDPSFFVKGADTIEEER